MAETSKATVAGVCDIVAGICGLVGGIPLLVLALVGSGVLAALPEAEVRPLAIIPLALFLPLAILCFVSGVVAIAGGVAAIQPASLGSGPGRIDRCRLRFLPGWRLQRWSSPSSPNPSFGPRRLRRTHDEQHHNQGPRRLCRRLSSGRYWLSAASRGWATGGQGPPPRWSRPRNAPKTGSRRSTARFGSSRHRRRPDSAPTAIEAFLAVRELMTPQRTALNEAVEALAPTDGEGRTVAWLAGGKGWNQHGAPVARVRQGAQRGAARSRNGARRVHCGSTGSPTTPGSATRSANRC